MCCWASSLQIFEQFINERLDLLNTGQGFKDVFEDEANIWSDKSGTQTKYREWVGQMKVRLRHRSLCTKLLDINPLNAMYLLTKHCFRIQNITKHDIKPVSVECDITSTR